MRAWSPWRHGGPHLVVPQRGCRWSRRKGLWCCWTCFSLWRVGFDGTLLARHGGLQMETRLIRLPALAMCDLRRTRCNRGPIYPRWTMPNEKYKISLGGYLRPSCLSSGTIANHLGACQQRHWRIWRLSNQERRYAAQPLAPPAPRSQFVINRSRQNPAPVFLGWRAQGPGCDQRR